MLICNCARSPTIKLSTLLIRRRWQRFIKPVNHTDLQVTAKTAEWTNDRHRQGKHTVSVTNKGQTESTVLSYPSVEPEAFTNALVRAANSVSIVTTDGTGGIAGLTVSSVCSVCADPPVILVCVSRDNKFCDAIADNQVFCVNLLSSSQQQLANVFAGLSEDPDEDRFLHGQWQSRITGSPVLQASLSSLDCELTDTHPHGTHHIYVGRVVAITSSAQEPLIYSQRTYAQLSLT